MNLKITSIAIDTSLTSEQFYNLDSDTQLDIYNKLLAQQLSLYLTQQKSKPSFENANFSDSYKLLKLFNARMLELGLVHGNLFEIVMDDYKCDFNILQDNRYLSNVVHLQNHQLFDQLNNEHIFYREAEFIYRTHLIDRYALADFIDLVLNLHIGLVPNMIPLTSLKMMFDLEFVDGSVHLVRNTKVTDLESFPVNQNEGCEVLDLYKGWARFNVGKIAFIMPYPKNINLDAQDSSLCHFRKDSVHYKRYVDLIRRVNEDSTILRKNNEITVCRILVDLLSNKISSFLKTNIAAKETNTVILQLRPFIFERKLRFRKANLPDYFLQEYFEWGDLNANIRWLLRCSKLQPHLTHDDRISLIRKIESPDYCCEQIIQDISQIFIE
jgi:hypothetical protein